MLFKKPHGTRDASTSAKRLDIVSNHPAIIAGSYIALLIFAVLLHRSASNGGWRGDGQQVLSVIYNPFWRLLFDRDAWLTFTNNAFTPILAAQYRVDMLLFGLNPRGFYRIHTAELAITATFTYHLLCQRMPRHLSLLATIGFLVALPTFSVMNFLQNRHYLTGLLLSICSVYIYLRALRGGRARNLLISAGLFFLAMLAKELYAVILLYFLLTSWGTAFFRRVLALYLLSFGGFAIWRANMLGSLMGGYSIDYLFIDRVAALDHVHRAIFGDDLVAAIFLVCVVVLILRHRLFGVRQLVGLAALLLAIYLPVLFATFALQNGGDPALRLSFFPAWLCAAGLAYVATQLRERGAGKTAGILLLAFIAATSSASVRRLGDFRDRLHEYDIQAKFIENAGPAAALFPTSLIGGDESSLHQQIALAAGHTPAGIILFRNDVFPGFTSYWEYDTHCRCLVQFKYAVVLEKALRLDQLNKPHDVNAPISLLFTWQARQGMASISIEPEGESTCLLSIPGMHSLTGCPKFPMPLSSRVPKESFALLHAQVFRSMNDNLVLATPSLSVPADGTLQWSRGVFLPYSGQTAGKSVACLIDTPTGRESNVSRDAPLELRGWISRPPSTRPDAIPLAILAGSAGKLYSANLHREERPDLKSHDGQVVGGHVLDADLRRVEPGTYRLLLGVEDAICDTSITMTLR